MPVLFYTFCVISAALFGFEAIIGKKNHNNAEIGVGIAGVIMSLAILIINL